MSCAFFHSYFIAANMYISFAFLNYITYILSFGNPALYIGIGILVAFKKHLYQ